MWSFCKRASGSQQAGKPGVESCASCKCRAQCSFQPALDPLTLHEHVSATTQEKPSQFVIQTKMKLSLKRKLQQSFKGVQSLGCARSLRHKLNSLPAWERGGRLIQFVWRKVLDMVDGERKEGKPDVDYLLNVRSSFSMPCKVHYVTTDCLHTQFWWGNKSKFTEATQPAAKHNCLSGGKITGEKDRPISSKGGNSCIYTNYANKANSLRY